MGAIREGHSVDGVVKTVQNSFGNVEVEVLGVRESWGGWSVAGSLGSGWVVEGAVKREDHLVSNHLDCAGEGSVNGDSSLESD